MDEIDGKIAEQPPVPRLAGQPGAGQVAAPSKDRDGAFQQELLVLDRHDSRQCISPQVMSAIPAVVEHPDQRDLPSEVIKGDRTACDLGDLAGGTSAERG